MQFLNHLWSGSCAATTQCGFPTGLVRFPIIIGRVVVRVVVGNFKYYVLYSFYFPTTTRTTTRPIIMGNLIIMGTDTWRVVVAQLPEQLPDQVPNPAQRSQNQGRWSCQSPLQCPPRAITWTGPSAITWTGPSGNPRSSPQGDPRSSVNRQAAASSDSRQDPSKLI